MRILAMLLISLARREILYAIIPLTKGTNTDQVFGRRLMTPANNQTRAEICQFTTPIHSSSLFVRPTVTANTTFMIFMVAVTSSPLTLQIGR